MSEAPGPLSPSTQRLIAMLTPFTPFAEAIVRRQVERAGLDVASLSEEGVTRVAPMIVAAAKVFLDPMQLAGLRRLLG